jgi:hypothetical protein
MSATAKVILLKGDPKNPESAEHIIKFPGGSIAVCRTSDNEYWAHIEVNHKDVLDDGFRESKRGEIVHSRVDRDYPHEMTDIEDLQTVNHLAVRIRTIGG